MSLSAIPKGLRDQIAARDKGACQYCHLAQFGQASVFHINHVVPKSKGGTTEESDLVLQCPYCSLHKSDKTSALDPQTGETALLFHPLVQNWVEHFQMDADGIATGLTSTGRATLVALRMNDPLPLVARRLQILLGILNV